ncbi:hypothetical protein QQS21_010019 [Conoideocrella luteorostrata]|uniref:Nitrogen regulatory protein areA GATA-like domain-containing protein n=1 Tax=Conoideocrella luteorostrata TaxID=1105319 RepID=A0AAJ0CKA1_9HYPO|nr:hypothetical protein QQS21_010019 [Conoideocrella luteorostrata]
MDSSVPMILPKGIVINTANIYKEVASYHVIPADKIWEYWHVYTTTNKKLKDPTARRLENFWWQVWGSDRKYLSGRALAKLYEDISVGPTIVPLHGPPNRWEGPDVPPLTRQMIVAHLNRDFDATQDRPEPPRMRSNDASIRSLSSSASKPPPSHPILKKSRSPLATGPKPTARFASPPDSDGEDVRESDIPSSGSTATTGLEMAIRSINPSTVTQNLTAAPTLPAHRPATNRRLSPQLSSVDVEVAARELASKKTRHAPTQLTTASHVFEPSANDSDDELKGTEGRTSTRLPVQPTISAKAAGKQPAVLRAVTNDSAIMCKDANRPALLSTSTSNAHSLRRNTSDLRSPVSTISMSLTRTDTENSSTAGSVTDSSSIIGGPVAQNGYPRKGSTQGLFTGATAVATNVAAHGQIIDQAGSLPASSILGPHVGAAGLTSYPSATSLLDMRMTPTQPSQVASVPMGRTRSQLTLLLEREKSRTGEKSRLSS